MGAGVESQGADRGNLPIHRLREHRRHGLNACGDGRMSRHYYDIHKPMGSAVGEKGCIDDALIEDCVSHARMFFYRNHTGLHEAKRGSFRLRPSDKMLGPLRGADL